MSRSHGTGSKSILSLCPPLGNPNGAVLSVWNWKDDISGAERCSPITKFHAQYRFNTDSPHTGNKLGTGFELVLGSDGTSLSIASIREDQELWDEDYAAAGGGFEGYTVYDCEGDV